MGAIDRTKYNLLVDDDGSGMMGTVWNKQQIRDVILDPGDLAWGRGLTLFQAAEGTDQNTAYHSLLQTEPLTGLTSKDAVILHYQFQSIAQPTSLSLWKGGTAVGDLVAPLAANGIAMGVVRVKQAVAQPNITAALIESVIYPSNARYDRATWTSTGEAWTAPFPFLVNCTGVPAGGTLYWSLAFYRLSGQ